MSGRGVWRSGRHLVIAATGLVAASCGKAEKAAAPAAGPLVAASAPAKPALDLGQWSNITEGIGYSLKFQGDRAVLVECETGGYCSAYRVENVKWDGPAVEMDIRFPNGDQRWSARVQDDGGLKIWGGIWRPQDLLRCDAPTGRDDFPPYQCPADVPPPAERGTELKGRFPAGPGAPGWTGITEWPVGVAKVLWGSESNGADPCRPVLEPPADAPDGWTRFWTWRVYNPEELTETAILYRVVKLGGRTNTDLSVVRRRQLSAWAAGSPGLKGVFMAFYPTAPGGIQSYFRIHGLEPGAAGKRPVLRSYSQVGRGGEAIDPGESLRRYQSGSPMEVGEHRDIGARRTDDVEVACEPIDLGVFVNQTYRLRDVADGRVERGLLTYLVADLTDSHPN
ncbi:hypothetical protein [Phenylobacterium parvum]|uniref:hypothetical protein n=1 Tax=Phenylobacterium parvum TaxID=2201350 RepID=UPI0013A5946D|nr:hypothetical protein [Phenylobacterium parvum]